MKAAERALHKVLMRNGYWKRETEKEALLLLRYSRPLLMRTTSSPTAASPPRATSPPLRTATSLFPFYALPNELKLHILGLLTPSLSSAQRMRIYNYASDTSTLPVLLPPLRRDPGQGLLAGNVPLSRREEERDRFLDAMGCCAYEPVREGQE